MHIEPLEIRRMLTAFVAHSGDSLQAYADKLKPGDTLDVNAGSYSGFVLTHSGTAARPIVITGKNASITRPGKFGDGINCEGSSYVIIDGFTTSGFSRAGFRAVTDTNVTFRNCTASGGKWGGFTGFAQNVTFEGCKFGNSGEHALYIGNSADNPIVRNCELYGAKQCGLHMNGDAEMGGDGVISNALVTGNYIHDCGKGGGAALNCDGLQNSRFENNRIVNCFAGGVTFYQDCGGGPSKNNVFKNNYVSLASGARWCVNIANGSTGNQLIGNVLSGGKGTYLISADSRAGTVIQ